MAVATKRGCRTCPAILANYDGAGETWDQCRPLRVDVVK